MANISKILKSSIVLYTLFGITFGLCFPAIAIFLLDEPDVLFGIISTAPFFLGSFSFYAGFQQEKTKEEIIVKTKELNGQKSLLELILNNMSEGVIAVNENFEFIIRNKEGKKIIGLGASNKNTHQWSEYYGYYYPDQTTPYPSEELPLIKAVQGTDTQDIPLFIKNKFIKEGCYLEASGRTLRDNEKIIGGVIVLRDVTEKRKKEKELLKAKQLAEEGVKAKARFLANMSHEIRTPMNAILSCTNLLLDNTKNPENLTLLKTTQSSSEILLALINDILDFSKIENGKLELENKPFNLYGNIKDIVELLSPKASEKGIVINSYIDPSVPHWIEGDVIRFKQVITNLIGNAIKFTKNKIKIDVTSKLLTGEKHEITFCIKDNGRGIPKSAKSKLFQDFSQVDASTTRKFGGTGLGLAICKGITQAMGGRIWAESQYGEGSLFYFTIVANKTQAEKEDKKEVALFTSSSNMAKEHPLRILLAEDNTINQMVAQKIIAKFGYKIDIAKTGLEAVNLTKSQNYDIILMDQHMPEMDGVEATKEIRKFAKDKPKIFALTASVFKEDRDRCLDAGMNGFLAKPIDINELISALQSCKPSSKS